LADIAIIWKSILILTLANGVPLCIAPHFPLSLSQSATQPKQVASFETLKWLMKLFLFTQRGEERLRKLVALLMLSLMLLFIYPSFSIAYALPAGSMWIDPSTLYFTNTTSVGFKFNVTVWLSMSTAANSWQFYLIYNKHQLNATRCNFTGNGQSQWSRDQPVSTHLAPRFGSHNSTYNYVFDGEVLTGSAVKTGSGSLSWVEFQILQAPAQGMTLKSELRLDVIGVFYSYVMDADLNKLPVSFGKSTYIFWSRAGSGLIGDITGPNGVPDGIVDVQDVALVVGCYGSMPGMSNWDPRADITGPTYLVPDGIVDVQDVALVVAHYGDHL
jgi:hypothetical protein